VRRDRGVPSTSVGRSSLAPSPRELFLRLLVRFIDQKRNVSPNKSPIYAPAKFAEQPEAKAAKVSSKAFAEAMEFLLASRQIVVHEEGPPSRPRAYLTLAGAPK
jgi:hypothetical protein